MEISCCQLLPAACQPVIIRREKMEEKDLKGKRRDSEV